MDMTGQDRGDLALSMGFLLQCNLPDRRLDNGRFDGVSPAGAS
jgi:hypothetical protein